MLVIDPAFMVALAAVITSLSASRDSAGAGGYGAACES